MALMVASLAIISGKTHHAVKVRNRLIYRPSRDFQSSQVMTKHGIRAWIRFEGHNILQPGTVSRYQCTHSAYISPKVKKRKGTQLVEQIAKRTKFVHIVIIRSPLKPKAPLINRQNKTGLVELITYIAI